MRARGCAPCFSLLASQLLLLLLLFLIYYTYIECNGRKIIIISARSPSLTSKRESWKCVCVYEAAEY